MLIRSNINLGFGGGNMLGNQYAKGTYLAFVNNDVIFVEDCFTSLIKFCENHPNCGVVTPQQYNSNDCPTTCFDHFHGLRKEFFGRTLVELTSNKPKRNNIPYKTNFKADFVQGCFMFFNAIAFHKIGGFDTNLFLYYEEMDTCFRLKKYGFEAWVCPETKFIHLHGASTTINYNIKKELIISRFYILKKNHSFIKYILIRFWYIVKYGFKSIFNFKYASFVTMLITGRFLESSLKQKQNIVVLDD